MGCLDEDTVLGFVEGRLSTEQRARVEQHLAECTDCFDLVTASARLGVGESSAAFVTVSGRVRKSSAQALSSAAVSAAASESVAEPDRAPAVAPASPRAPDPAIDSIALAVDLRALAAAMSRDNELAAGTAIGRYVILGLVGRGGMGEVYAAYDPQLDRRVALKLLHESEGGDEDRASARVRLLREAKAIARLSHPNVVSVYDAGAVDGQVFVAMEFVEGQTLGEWVAGTRRGAATKANPWREILAKFLLAGRGLAAAHAARIVHRDFKPQNVMVGADGQVRVMDFGLAGGESSAGWDDAPVDPRGAQEARARATAARASASALASASADDAFGDQAPTSSSSADAPTQMRPVPPGLTRTGALIGTPAYMAPEQFRAEHADARTDQFSFCVALYEALFGERPFASNTIAELVDAVSKGRVRETAGSAAVPAWLRRVLLRGLRAKREERYPSMVDLLSALEHDPARRRRRLVVVAIAATCVVAGGLVAVRFTGRAQTLCRGADAKLAGIWEPDGEGVAGPSSRRGRARAAFLATGRDFAADTWSRVAGMLDGYAHRWTRMYTDACEATHVRGEQSGEALDLRMACLSGDLGALRTLTDVFIAGDASVVVGATSAARSLPDLDRCADLKLLRAAVPPPDDPRKRAEVEALRRELVELKVLKDAGRARANLARAEAAVARARTLGYQPVLAEALWTLTSLDYSVRDFARSESAGKETLWLALGNGLDEIAEKAAEMLLGVVAHHLSRFEEGKQWDAMAESILTRLGPGHDLQWAWLWEDRGAISQKQGALAPAHADLQKALALKEKVLGSDSPDVGISYNNIAVALMTNGDYRGAAAAAANALERFTRAYGPDHPELATVLNNQGEALQGLGRVDEALVAYRHCLAVWQPEIGANHPLLGYPYTGIGVALLSRGDIDGAVRALERALVLRERGESDPIPLAETRFALARALGARGDHARAYQLAEQARAARARVPGFARGLAEVDAWLVAHRDWRATPSRTHRGG